MRVTLLGIVMLVKPVARNAYSPIVVRALGNVILVRLLQSLNVCPLMLVTLLGIVTLSRLVHLANAPSLMLVTLLGIVMLVKPAASNAYSPIVVRAFLWRT